MLLHSEFNEDLSHRVNNLLMMISLINDLVVFVGPLSHVAWAIGFAGLGYIGHRIERYETARLEVERDRLVKRRMLRSE